MRARVASIDVSPLLPLVVFLLVLAAPAAAQPQGEVLADIRVHGNHTTPDAEIVKLAGIAIGDPVAADTASQVASRLRASRRFDQVEVRRRYRSLTETTQVSLIILVREYPSAAADPGLPLPGPMRRIRDATMFMPILNYQDGYGFTYGGRASFVDVLGRDGRVSIPLTWGGTKRAAIEIEKAFDRGPIGRVQGGVALQRRENPHFELNDDRQQIWARADREIVRGLRLGGQVGWTDVGFGPRTRADVRQDARFTTIGADLTFDTRHDPIFPRNAVYARTGWESLHFDRGPTINRYRSEARGYLGVIGQSVLSVRALFDNADAPLPPYEQALLGGAATVRGFRAGAFAGDNLFASSAELRVPLSSPMGVSRAGVSVFVDAGTVYNEGQPLRDARFERGVGAGVFLLATVFQLNLDVAYGVGHKVRVHFMTGFQF